MKYINYIAIMAFMLAAGCCPPEKGDRGEVGPQGVPGESIVGPAGAPGADGESIVGPAGQDGTDATPVTVVKFCPESPSYGTFPEYGICLQGQLYAVYSTHGGFLALISPGRYSSNAVNSACDFTVGENCQVSP